MSFQGVEIHKITRQIPSLVLHLVGKRERSSYSLWGACECILGFHLFFQPFSIRAWRVHHKHSSVCDWEMQDKLVWIQTSLYFFTPSSVCLPGLQDYFFPGKGLQLGILSQGNRKGVAVCLSRQLVLCAASVACSAVLESGHWRCNGADLVTWGEIGACSQEQLQAQVCGLLFCCRNAGVLIKYFD